MISDSNYPKNRTSHNCSEYTCFGYKVFLAPAVFAVLSREVKVSAWAHLEQHSAHREWQYE